MMDLFVLVGVFAIGLLGLLISGAKEPSCLVDTLRDWNRGGCRSSRMGSSDIPSRKRASLRLTCWDHRYWGWISGGQCHPLRGCAHPVLLPPIMAAIVGHETPWRVG